MPFILKLLTGSAGGWILAGAMLAASAAGGAAGYAGRGLIDAPPLLRAQLDTKMAQGETTTCKLQHETARADGAEEVVTALRGAADVATAVMNGIAAKANARSKADEKFLKDLANVPISTVCGNSAAELAYRRSVQ